MKMKTLHCILPTLCVCFTFGPFCLRSESAITEKQELKNCHRDGTRITLCFDLRDDSRLTAGLIIYTTNKDNTETRLLLPFKTSRSASDNSVLSTVGSAEGATLVTFFSSSVGTSVIDLEPVFDLRPNSDNDRMSDSPLSFVVNGLERRFVYRSSIDRKDISQEAKDLFTQYPDEIGIARPINYEGLEVTPGSGKTEMPSSVDHNEVASFFSSRGSDGKPAVISVRYRVPPTSAQTLIVSMSSKVVAALIAPFVALLFLPRSKNLRPKVRRIILWSLGALQLGLIVTFAYQAWRTSSESTTAAIGDWIIVLFTAAGTTVPLWLEKDQAEGELAIKVPRPR